jgi:hypothetical protein
MGPRFLACGPQALRGAILRTSRSDASAPRSVISSDMDRYPAVGSSYWMSGAMWGRPARVVHRRRCTPKLSAVTAAKCGLLQCRGRFARCTATARCRSLRRGAGKRKPPCCRTNRHTAAGCATGSNCRTSELWTLAENRYHWRYQRRSKTPMEGEEMKTLVPALVTVLGLALMIMQIQADSEPGAIPLSLIVIGVSWLFIARARKRRHHA